MSKHPATGFMLDELEATDSRWDDIGAEVESFAKSMPRSYREIFDAGAIETHAGIVERRGTNAMHVEVWKEDPDGMVAVCIVGIDRPGLLSQISAAFVAHDMDVMGAQAYCRRRPDGRVEAIDFFWVRRLSSVTGTPLPVRPGDIESFGKTLDALLVGRARPQRSVRYTRSVRAIGHSTRLRFEHREPEGYTILTVEGQDRPGLLLAITAALFEQKVQIVRSEVSTTDEQVLDRFHLTELDGSPLQRARLLGLQNAVLAAADSDGSSSARPPSGAEDRSAGHEGVRGDDRGGVQEDAVPQPEESRYELKQE
jgi:[protein-PII] uridylyltransferase